MISKRLLQRRYTVDKACVSNMIEPSAIMIFRVPYARIIQKYYLLH